MRLRSFVIAMLAATGLGLLGGGTALADGVHDVIDGTVATTDSVVDPVRKLEVTVLG
ncbi:hypothetical protein SAMN02982929_05669 [Saccharopolyspora kobensis]|uniref:Uncharacterized protein n=1 Tax=Saccharopolyspora kobensis TaxID=146035 RepID=A0A1H6E580_9PSEU|nr:hypothetical protein [Saccharopolyspora kobensis]SEG92850.1 hypothetical protein SAMN02982929_05669 [Saccharopolyspora kobensis]SFD40742.1 hypothetical protein SAMN05216506_104199 [Saccharopolyspora kobensis]